MYICMFKAHVMKVNEYENEFCLIVKAMSMHKEFPLIWDTSGNKNESIKIETAEL
jgi:hypothetical protein